MRGKLGTIIIDHGVFVTPDTVAHGQGEQPQHVYCVAFTGDELWGGNASPKDKVCIDLLGQLSGEGGRMSDALSLDAVQLPRDEAGPVFDKPWQAQAFALTVQLYKSGHFTWPEWVEVFSREIKASPATPEESVNDAYYRQWMAALETITAARQLVAPTDVPAAREEWRQAYLNTPHGQPILLANAVCRPATVMVITITRMMRRTIITTIISRPQTATASRRHCSSHVEVSLTEAIPMHIDRVS